MNSQAIKACLKAVTQNLLQEFKSYLLIGTLCRLDYSPDEKCVDGEKVIVAVRQPIPPPQEWKDSYPPPATRDCDFRLTHKSHSFVISDVTELIMGNISVSEDVREAAEYLSEQAEAELLTAMNGFVSYAGGDTAIDAHLLDNLDSFLFDKGTSDESIYMVTPSSTPILQKLIESKSYIELYSPDPEYAGLLISTVAFRRDAVGLVTRGIKLPVGRDQVITTVEDDNLGLTIVATPEGKSLRIDIHLLYAAGLLRGELGIKIQTQTQSQSTASTSQQLSDIGPQIAPVIGPLSPTMDAVRAELPGIMSDLLIERLHTTMDSLADLIPDTDSRMRAALKLMQRADGIRPESIIESCDRQLERLTAERVRFTESVDAHCEAEIVSREESLDQTTDAILEAEKHLQNLRDQHLRLQEEISSQNQLIADSTADFNLITGLFESAATELRGKLEWYLPGHQAAHTNDQL